MAKRKNADEKITGTVLTPPTFTPNERNLILNVLNQVKIARSDTHYPLFAGLIDKLEASLPKRPDQVVSAKPDKKEPQHG